MTRPLISYYGGKQRMARRIVPLLPQHTVYVEPFAGGAAVLFAKPWPAVGKNQHYREVINDIDGDLINLYRMAQERPAELAHLIDCTAYSQAENARSNSILRRKEPADPLTLAWAYYVNLQQSFANKKHGGWGRAVASRNHAATWHARDAWAPIERLRSAYICQADALEVISQWDSPQTLFYCDPPYPGTDCGHYKGYAADDYAALVATLDACEGAFVLSQYAVLGVDIPADWERFEFATYCSSDGKGRAGRDRGRAATAEKLGDRKRTEVVYRRFNRRPWRPELEVLRLAGKYDCFARRDPAQLPLPTQGIADDRTRFAAI